MLLIFNAVSLGKRRNGMLVEGTAIARASMDDEAFSLPLFGKSVSAVGTLKYQGRNRRAPCNKSVAAYLAEKLPPASRIVVEILV